MNKTLKTALIALAIIAYAYASNQDYNDWELARGYYENRG